MLVTLIVFILVFSIVVIAHELGHFLIAKLNGIKVLEFAIGMGPALVKFTKGETKYVLRLLPLGGACMFEGEDGVYSSKEEGNEKQKTEGSFSEAKVWARIATVFAGPFFNIILAFLLSLIVVGFSGTMKPTINGLKDGYPAKEAGLEVGDVITKMDGTSKGGIILAIRDELGVPVRFIGLGEKMDDLEEFDLDQYLYGLCLSQEEDE